MKRNFLALLGVIAATETYAQSSVSVDAIQGAAPSLLGQNLMTLETCLLRPESNNYADAGKAYKEYIEVARDKLSAEDRELFQSGYDDSAATLTEYSNEQMAFFCSNFYVQTVNFWLGKLSSSELAENVETSQESKEEVEVVASVDGRRFRLYNDQTFELLESSRNIHLTLQSIGPATGFASNPQRDCGLSFTVENNLGGELFYFQSRVQIVGSDGSEILDAGIMPYEIAPTRFFEGTIASGATEVVQIDVDAECKDIKEVIIGEISERDCNYVGRLPGEKCRDIVTTESSAEIAFRK